ncbi:MAG: hypothetical protein JXA92_06025 [candidate division Zixibacteria bacterium]|nr:hypothetical protein [candidate division Zixibacteria bacterium]
MLNAHQIVAKYGNMKKINYFVINFLDFQDALNTTSQMIDNGTDPKDNREVKKMCEINTRPLKGRSAGFILTINIPEKIVK